jgi:diguanylate cyclase (GGDEF)-like protein/PAS domain S-box-containing protein
MLAPDTANDDHEALIQFLYLAPVGLAQIHSDGEIGMVNPICAQLLMPLSHDGGLSNLFTALQGVAPDLRHLVAAFAAERGVVCDGLRIRVTAGGAGSCDPQMLALTVVKLDKVRLMAVLVDITAQVRRERLARQNEAWLHAIMTGVTDYALVSLDHEGRIEDWNESIGRVTGFSAEQVVGQSYALFYPPGATTPDHVVDRLREADQNGWSLDDGWRLKADGSRFWCSAMIAVLPEAPDVALPRADADDAGYCLVLRDITEKRDAAEAHRRSTGCDHLTGVANRRTFFERAELEFERWKRAPRPLSLLYVDVDPFKAVNDEHGHAAGDAVLRQVGATLGTLLREVDLVARVGGEEFAMLLPSTGMHGALEVAELLRAEIAAQTTDVEGAPIRVTLSVGVASMEPDVASVDGLLKRADRALYAAKRAGRNRVECWVA